MSIEELYNIYLRHGLISTDTRKILPGSLFFALKGSNFDGNEFAEKALDLGASLAVIDEASYRRDERFLLVPNVLESLQQLARYHRERLLIPVLGITGTNGKTTTKELLKSVLSQRFNTYATVGNLNNHIGVPLTLLSVGKDIEFAIIEMGANHKKEIEALCTIARPSHGLITNVGKAHLEGFGSFEGVKEAKGELYAFLKSHGGTTFINGNNPHLLEMYGNREEGNVIYYGNVAGSTVEGRIVENDPFLTVEWTSGKEHHHVKTNLTGSYNLENILAAIAVGLDFGLTAKEINAGIAAYMPGNNRSQIVKTESNTIICDYYNANPSSMAVALDNLESISFPGKALILGDMFELGDDAEQEHRKIIERVAQMHLKTAVFIGKEFYRERKNKYGRFYETTEEALEGLKDTPIVNSVVLVKGSRGMQLERLIRLL